MLKAHNAIVLILSCLALTGCSSSEQSSANAPATTTNTAIAAISEPKSQSAKEEKPKEDPIAGAGATWDVGKLHYELVKVAKKKQLGNMAMGGKKAEDGSIYYVIAYKLTNKTNQTVTIASDNFKLVSQDGVEFSPDSDGATALMMSGDKSDFLLSQLQPGVRKSATTVFLLPEDKLKDALYWKVPSEEMFSEPGTVRIK